MLTLRPALAAAFVLATVAPAAATGGLSPNQMAELRPLGFAVVPNPPPTGFHVTTISVDSVAESYRVVYKRSDGATLIFTGRKLSAPPTPEPRKRHGLFNSIADAVNHIGVHPAAATNPQVASNGNGDATSNEEEEEMSSVEAYSPVVGPAHFAEDHGCLTGSPEPGQVTLAAVYHMTGCNLARPDALTRAYRALVRIGS